MSVIFENDEGIQQTFASQDEHLLKPLRQPLFLYDYENEIRKHKGRTSEKFRMFLKSDKQLFGELHQSIRTDKFNEWIMNVNSSIQKKRNELSLVEADLDSLQLSVDTLCGESLSEQAKLTLLKDEFVLLSNSCYHKRKHAQLAQSEAELHTAKSNALLNAKQFFESCLGFQIELVSSNEEGYIFILCFDEFTNLGEKEMSSLSVKLLYDFPWMEKSGRNPSAKWHLLETSPPLPAMQNLAETLETSQNICGMVCAVREEFQKLPRPVE